MSTDASDALVAYTSKMICLDNECILVSYNSADATEDEVQAAISKAYVDLGSKVTADSLVRTAFTNLGINYSMCPYP